MRISDWSSDVCSSDLLVEGPFFFGTVEREGAGLRQAPPNGLEGSLDMKTLVWVEHDGKAVKDATLAVVTAASKLGEVHLLVAGSGVDAVAKDAAGIAGVQKVHVADNAAFAHNLPENVPQLDRTSTRL